MSVHIIYKRAAWYHHSMRCGILLAVTLDILMHAAQFLVRSFVIYHHIATISLSYNIRITSTLSLTGIIIINFINGWWPVHQPTTNHPGALPNDHLPTLQSCDTAAELVVIDSSILTAIKLRKMYNNNDTDILYLCIKGIVMAYGVRSGLSYIWHNAQWNRIQILKFATLNCWI